MKSTGIVRKLDTLGRVVIPIELRRTLDINVKDPLEIFVDDVKIILKKFSPSCIFCGESKDIFDFKGKKVCQSCSEKIKNK